MTSPASSTGCSAPPPRRETAGLRRAGGVSPLIPASVHTGTKDQGAYAPRSPEKFFTRRPFPLQSPRCRVTNDSTMTLHALRPVLLLPLLVALPAAAQSDLLWVKVLPADKSFSALFPATPTRQTEK